MTEAAPQLHSDQRAKPRLAAIPRPAAPHTFNLRSKQRFTTDRRRALTAHLGGAPSYPQMLLISRIIAIEWELRRQDAKLDAGEELSGHAMRARLAAENRLRLDLQALGPTAAARPPTPAEALQRVHDFLAAGGNDAPAA